MARQKRRLHTAKEKVAMLRLHLLEQQPVSEICDEHGIKPSLFYRWQKQFFENGTAAFTTKKVAKRDTRDQTIAELQHKIVDRDEGLAELMLEHVKLKKKLGLS